MATKYISAAGSDTTGDGSIGSPWATLGYAVQGSRMTRGDTLMLLTDNVLPNNVTMAIAAGVGDTTIDLNGFTLRTSAATTNTLRPVAWTINIQNGTISVDHAISLGIFRNYVSAHIKYVNIELVGSGSLSGLLYENAAINTEITIDNFRSAIPCIPAYIGTKPSGSVVINLKDSILKKCTKIWTGSGVFALTVRSLGRCVFHGCADASVSGGLIVFPSNASVADKSAWDVDIHGHVFIQGDGTTSGSNIVYSADTLAGRGTWVDVFESKFKDNIIYNYNDDYYDVNASAQKYYDRAFHGVTDMFDIAASNVWRPPYAVEPTTWAEYANVQEWSQPVQAVAAIVGDSIVWGTGSTGAAVGAAHMLGVYLGGGVVSSQQSGMPGLGIDGLRWWVDRMMCKFPARYVSVQIGINNAKAGGTYSGLTDQQLADHAAFILSVIDARGATPVWLGFGADVGGSIVRAEAVNAAMKTICATNGWLFYPWIEEAKKNASWATEYYDDVATNIHPNDAGHLLIGEVAERAVRQLNDGIVWGMRTPFDSTLPALSLAPTCPGSLLEVQEWRRADVTKRQMDAVSR